MVRNLSYAPRGNNLIIFYSLFPLSEISLQSLWELFLGGGGFGIWVIPWKRWESKLFSYVYVFSLPFLLAKLACKACMNYFLEGSDSEFQLFPGWGETIIFSLLFSLSKISLQGLWEFFVEGKIARVRVSRWKAGDNLTLPMFFFFSLSPLSEFACKACGSYLLEGKTWSSTYSLEGVQLNFFRYFSSLLTFNEISTQGLRELFPEGEGHSNFVFLFLFFVFPP